MPSTAYKGFALVDCNNFYVSCERVFKPHLEKKPAVVLSNNDGCIIARSSEIKEMGIPMGAPLFKYQHLFKMNQVEIFSPNFALYADMSDRVMQVLYDFSSDMEIYSIDEAFIPITSQNTQDFLDLQRKVKKWTGIPISIGLAKTKTRAKLASYLAKKKAAPIYSLLEIEDFKSIYQNIPIDAVWGIGRRLSEKLRNCGVHTVQDFCERSEDWVRQKFHLPGLRTYLELKGISCTAPSFKEDYQKSLTFSNSFGEPIQSFERLSETVSHYTSRAAHKLREKKLHTQMIALYLKTSTSSFHQSVSLDFPTSFTPHLVEAALKLLKTMYKKETYKKAGIYLFELTKQGVEQLDFRSPNLSKENHLMATIDQINALYGKGTLFYASEGFQKPWLSKRNRLTCEYTTKLAEILKIQI